MKNLNAEGSSLLTVYWRLCWRMNHEIHHSNPDEGMANAEGGGIVAECDPVDVEAVGAGREGEVGEDRRKHMFRRKALVLLKFCE